MSFRLTGSTASVLTASTHRGRHTLRHGSTHIKRFIHIARRFTHCSYFSLFSLIPLTHFNILITLSDSRSDRHQNQVYPGLLFSLLPFQLSLSSVLSEDRLSSLVSWRPWSDPHNTRAVCSAGWTVSVQRVEAELLGSKLSPLVLSQKMSLVWVSASGGLQYLCATG